MQDAINAINSSLFLTKLISSLKNTIIRSAKNNIAMFVRAWAAVHKKLCKDMK
jgi:hypothetical protein